MNTPMSQSRCLHHAGSGRVVVVGGLSAHHHLTMLAVAMASRCELIVLPEHIQPPTKAMIITDLEVFKASQEPKLADWLPLKESKRDRTHPNEPFYRKLNKRRRQW